jgi:hypothetical protein
LLSLGVAQRRFAPRVDPAPFGARRARFAALPVASSPVPLSGICACGEGTEDAELACILESAADADHRCAGVQRCGADGPSACEPALGEACNGQDDDCDGATDEEFRDGEGRYVDRLHCGACATPCVEPGPT